MNPQTPDYEACALPNAELNFGLNTILFSKRHGSIMVEATVKLQAPLESYIFQNVKDIIGYPVARASRT